MEIKELLEWYRNGRRPPLDKLVSKELLKIFQRGVVQKNVSSFGLLLPAQDKPEGTRERWLEGEFINVGYRWVKHCEELREWQDADGRKTYDEKCQLFDKTRAFNADTLQEPIVSMCHGGMVDYALPIVVDGRTVAVLFAGQQCPAEGNVWSEEMISGYVTEENIKGSEYARAETLKRNNRIMEEMASLSSGGQVPSLVQYALAAPEITPEEVPGIVEEMKDTANQLSQLAEQTIDYQQNVMRAHFTSQVARLLSESDIRFWNGFSTFLRQFADFYERDYAFFYMLKRPTDDSMQLCTKPPDGLQSGTTMGIARSAFYPLKEIDRARPVRLSPSEAKKRLFSNNMLFDSPCYVIPLEVNGPLGVVVMGNTKGTYGQKLIEREVHFVKQVFEDVSIVLENRRQFLTRDLYVTDLAHEVKSPVAAVLATAENLAAGRVAHDQVKLRADEMLRRLRRLMMNVDRFGFLERLLSNPESLKRGEVSVYEVAKECESELKDMAGERGMKLIVKPELRGLPSIYTDRSAFKHALANMIHNSIKYGDQGTEVVIEGRTAGTEVKIDVGDIGIPIHEEEKKLLGQRNFRTNAARRRDPSGTGIGFTIIDRFLKIAGGRFEVESIPHGDGRHHVIISMFLPRK